MTVDHEQLKDWYLQAVNESADARQKAERDRDYYDGKQWTDAEIAELRKRRQPAIVVNRIKPKIDNLLGLEIRSRTDPKGFPRTPDDEDVAEAATDALRFVADNVDFDKIRSKVSEDIFIEGTGAGIIEVEQKRGRFEITVNRIPWDRFFEDPHSTQSDGKDAKFMGQAIWMDKADALALFKGVDESVITAGLEDQDAGDTYDDKPRQMFYDASRGRLKVIEIYFHDEGWKHAIFTGLGMLVDIHDSAYVDEDGEPVNPIEKQSAFMDRDNNSYGVVRQLISIQDEINKRRSKALHIMNTRQVIADEGAVEDVNNARRELTKPDGYIKTNPNKRFEIQETGDLAIGQFNLLQEAKDELDSVGSNAALTGKEERNLSGRALLARQEGGMLELGPVMDGVRDWQKRIYRQVWYRIKQFWDEERWIRVTDDEKNLKFVGINRPVTRGEQMGIPPEAANDPLLNQVVAVENDVKKLDLDIILEDVPDTVNIQAEQFELLANMFQAKPDAIPFEMIIEASSIRNKDRIIERLKGDTPEQQAAVQAQNELTQRAAVAEIAKDEAKAALDSAKAEQTEVETVLQANGF